MTPHNEHSSNDKTKQIWEPIWKWFQSKSPIFLLAVLAFISGDKFQELTDPEYRVLKEEIKELQSKNESLETQVSQKDKELEGLSKLSIPNILNSSPDENLYTWGKTIPQEIISYIQDSEKNNIDNILSVTVEPGENQLTLEVKVQIGNSLSPKDIKEYDFVCTQGEKEVEKCSPWVIEETERPTSFADINLSKVRNIIREKCQKEWQILQVEASDRYDSGGRIKEKIYEIICVVKEETNRGDVDWYGIEVHVTEQGNATTYPIVD